MGFPRQEYWSGLPFPSVGKIRLVMTQGLYGWTFGPQRFTLLFYLYVKFFNDGEEKKKNCEKKEQGLT